jgi:hypothetical protein
VVFFYVDHFSLLQAYVDLAFYFDTPTMHKLVKFYSENSPLQCEVDAYGDFLQALGPGATAKYCWETSSGKLARQQAVLREKLFNVLKETPLRVVIFHEVTSTPTYCMCISCIEGVFWCTLMWFSTHTGSI